MRFKNMCNIDKKKNDDESYFEIKGSILKIVKREDNSSR